ncbi:MAG: TerC family protein [Syntrophales bacterium]|nr:TerC family protein [Syntrophales bacterium]
MIDLGFLGSIELTGEFLVALLSITLIDLILAGDNAVVIAMAVQCLPPAQRKKGIVLGAGAAVALRVIFAFVASQMLLIEGLKLAGGIVILWIGWKLLVDSAKEKNIEVKTGKTVLQAVWIIVIADVSMSLDNILAIAGASRGNFFLLLFGVALSIPLVVAGSSILSLLIDRYPFILYLGAAVLGRVGGEMIITDPFVVSFMGPSKFIKYTVEVICAIGVIVLAVLWMRRVDKEPPPLRIRGSN